MAHNTWVTRAAIRSTVGEFNTPSAVSLSFCLYLDAVVGKRRQRRAHLVCLMDSTTPAQPRLRIPRQSALSPWSGSDHYLQVPQAGPSRLSPQMNAFDALGEDDDSQATPRVPTRPQLETPSDATPSNSVFQTGSARLRAILAKENEHEQTSRRPSSPPPPRRRYDSMSDMESDFESPHATVAQSQHLESLKEIFTKFHADTTPRNRRSSGRRNSIDLSEVEDSPRVERVREERAMHKGKRRSASDEEAEIYTSALVSCTRGSQISWCVYRKLRRVRNISPCCVCCKVRCSAGQTGFQSAHTEGSTGSKSRNRIFDGSWYERRGRAPWPGASN